MIASKTSQIATRFDQGETVCLSFHYHNKFNITFLNSLVTKILSRNNVVYLRDTVVTVLKEIIVNAVKANSKRFFFKLQNLNILDTDDYMTGMRDFKDFIVAQKELIESDLKKNNFNVKIYFKKAEKGIYVFVRNNAGMLPEEMSRVQDRLQKARAYTDFSEIYEDISDDSEGEGLGLLLTVLFLRNSGIGEQSLKIESVNGVTQTSLVIPEVLKPGAVVNKIQSRIIEEVEELPSFPENIIELISMCKKPDVSIRDISDRIVMDPAMSASVLRLSNSAGFITRKRIDSIHDAVKIIGLKNLNMILVASSARNIMTSRYSSFREIWNHCNRTAFYARQIALQNGLTKLAEHAFLAGLLHDLGKIVLLSTTTKLAEWISEFTRNREMRTSTVLEEIAIGMSHSSLGARIAEKWNLPHYIIESIRHHHSPLNADPAFLDIVATTYMAKFLCGIESGRYEFAFMEEEILKTFSLSDEESFKEFHSRLREQFDEHNAVISSAS
jgi:putative nucleotidyltransferase with HDIG domain